MAPIELREDPEIANFLQRVQATWLRFAYVYRVDGRLVGSPRLTSRVIKNGHTLNLTDLTELTVDELPQKEVRRLAGAIILQDWEAATELRRCLSGKLAPSSEEVREAARQAALRFSPEYDTPQWQGETLDELREWIVRWLLRPQVTKLLKECYHEGLSSVGLFHQRRKALEASKSHNRIAA